MATTTTKTTEFPEQGTQLKSLWEVESEREQDSESECEICSGVTFEECAANHPNI